MSVEGITPLRSEAQELSLPAGGSAVRIDLSLYEVDSVMRASYKLTDQFYLLLIDHVPHREVVVCIWPKSLAEVGDVIGRFCEELLEQSLRLTLEKKTHVIRDLIVAQAFAEGNLLDPLREGGDYEADPMAIAGSRGKS